MTTLLLISGSTRRGSTNTAVLQTASASAPDGVEAILFGGIGELPLFNPDHDREGMVLDPRVVDLRTAIARADGLLICTPEYAGALPAALKNLLEWTIGDGGTYGKPVAWINAAGPAAPTGAAEAHASLRAVLVYSGARIVEDACVRIPITRDLVGRDGVIINPGARTAITRALATFAAAARAQSAAPPAAEPGHQNDA